MEIRYSNCYFCTSKGCGMRVYVKDDRIEKVRINTRAPVHPGRR